MTTSHIPEEVNFPLRVQPEIATQSRACLASVAALAIILVGFGCESDPSGQAQPASLRGVTIHDSAGVEIVVNQAPERSYGSFWSLSPEPEFVLGGAEHGLAWEEEWDDRTRDELAAMIFGVPVSSFALNTCSICRPTRWRCGTTGWDP